ncbi:hypothetical protein R1sor_015683 [Riccia sorocarpa]|uniref:Reverse transcriptase domain-containing protein n=1 Tax=Riccia sorocarpa TaxID=122646 RepID=A0ABD3HJ24_9MARC
MTVSHLKVATWNVMGLFSNHRKEIVRRWIRRTQRGTQIIALQEVIAKGEELQKSMKTIFPGAKTVVDYKWNGNSDSVLIIRQGTKVVAEGVSGQGYGAWAIIETSQGNVGIMALHAPRKRSRRAAVWAWVKSIIGEGQWLLLGDFNMVERTRDALGPSAVIRGRELRSWTLCANLGDLVDAWIMAAQGEGRLKSYFKMRKELMEKPEVLQAAEELWSAHPEWAREDRKRWALALGRLGMLLMEEKNKQEREKEDVQEMQDQLQRARWAVQRTQTEETTEDFEKILRKLRHREKLDAQMCRQRSRIRWIQEGDAPNKFFFTYLKAKTARENITMLLNEDGSEMKEQGEIFTKIEETYAALYTGQEEGPEIGGKRRAILQLIDKKFSSEQNEKIREIPSTELIEDIVKALPAEKSPGIDGVISEILILGWHFMKDDCCRMVRRVWHTRKLLQRDNRGVIKLLPKNDEIFWLQNWRPITLLTSTYKIIAKIIAVRLREMVLGVADRQQTGFIAGRDITENVLSLRLAQE